MTNQFMKTQGTCKQITIGDVEQNVPLPPLATAKGESMFPYKHMMTGDSFYVAYYRGPYTNDMPHDQKKVLRRSVSGSARRREIQYPGERYATRSDNKGIRVWRTA